jgi:hypothetical protein
LVEEKNLSWADLLDRLRSTSDEKSLLRMLKQEASIDRKLRIYSRYSKLRRERELRELQNGH